MAVLSALFNVGWATYDVLLELMHSIMQQCSTKTRKFLAVIGFVSFRIVSLAKALLCNGVE